jgi:membrane-bound lytic murein transglycosylase B
MKPHHTVLPILMLLVPALGAAAAQDSAVSSPPVKERRETNNGPSAAFLRGVQRQLKRAGYDPGIQDGKMGPATRYALKRFQEDQGLPATGEPDVPTLTRLLEQSLRR